MPVAYGVYVDGASPDAERPKSTIPGRIYEFEIVRNAFFSRQTDRYRRAYDRSTAYWPRQCVFLGSSQWGVAVRVP